MGVVSTNRGFVRSAAFVAVLLAPALVHAQIGLDATRIQSDAITRAIGRNTESALLFRPKLVITKGATGPVTAGVLSRNEHYLLSAAGDNSVRVWDLFIGREVARLRGHTARIEHLDISDNGRFAVTSSADHTIRIWNLERMAEAAKLSTTFTAVTDVALGPDGSRVAVASADGTIVFFGLPAGNVIARIQAHRAGRVRLAHMPNGQLMSAGEDGQVATWDMSNGRKLASLSAGGAVTAVAVSSDGRSVALATGNGTLQDVDASPLRLRGAFKVPGRSIATLAFDAAGTSVIVGETDGKVRVWRVSDGSLVREFARQDGAITFTALSRDGAFALTSSEDGTMRLWNNRTDAQLLTLLSTKDGWAVVDSKGRFDGSDAALAGIEWQANDTSLPVESFSDGYQTVSLLARTLIAPAGLVSVPSVTDGVHYPPKVSFLAPTTSGAVSARHVSIEVQADADRGGGLTEMYLYRNGHILQPARVDKVSGGPQGGTQRITSHYEVDISAGSTQFAVAAVNDQRIESRPATLTLRAPGSAAVGALHALFVGINHYHNPKYNLDYGRPDAEALAGFFRAAHPGAPRVAEVLTLLDGDATKERILATLARMQSTGTTDDAVVVYLAGHGISLGDEWYFIPSDVDDLENAEAIARHGLSATELRLEMEAQTADRSLVLIDSCMSGTAVSPLTDYRGIKSLRRLARSAGSHIIVATDKQESAHEFNQLGHGIFTYIVLRTLDGGIPVASSGGDVTAAELAGTVEQEVPRLMAAANLVPQHPTAYSRGIDFELSHPGR